MITAIARFRGACLLLLASISFSSVLFAQGADEYWAASWGSSPYQYFSFGGAGAPQPFEEVTLRQVVMLSVGGDQVSIRFSNEHGAAPLFIGAASVALVDEGASVAGESIHALTFGGETSVTVPPGAPVLSDPVDLGVEVLDALAVSLYLPQPTEAGTYHGGRISYVTDGDMTQAVDLPDAEASTGMFFLSGVYVNRKTPARVLVAFGDSITDGTGSTPFSFNSWPDYLSRRLAAEGIDDLAVVNQGIAGNQVLQDGIGISALARFDRDVLATPGLSHIVILEGINDIGSGGTAIFGTQTPERTPEDIIAGYRQLISRAHSIAPHVKIFGATLLPFQGAGEPYYSDAKNEVRKAVNSWIRTSGAFDGVIDFDLAVRDAANPEIIRMDFNSGDNLHPGDAGYEHMADSIDLSLFD